MDLRMSAWIAAAVVVLLAGPPIGMRLGLAPFVAAGVGIVPSMLLLYPALSAVHTRAGFAGWVVAVALSAAFALAIGRLTSQW